MKSRSIAFWVLHATGWLTYTGVAAFFRLGGKWGDSNLVLLFFIVHALGFISCIPLRVFYKKIGFHERPLILSLLIAVAASFVDANLWFGMETLIGLFTKVSLASSLPFMRIYIIAIFNRIIPLLIWTSLYFGIKTWMEWRLQEARREKANVLAQGAQLRMLRYQLNPHFLFNSLNSIRALIDEDEAKAREMITELSEFLRYSLESKDYGNVPLKHEMEAIRHYFAIQKKRYEDKLNVDYDIDAQAGEYPLLSFLIHPLVENAVKYGMRTSAMPLFVGISAKTNAAGLTVEVRNTGKWVDPGQQESRSYSGTGTGLDNVRLRLENAFPGRHRFEFFEKEGSVHVRLEIRGDAGVAHEKIP